MAVECRLQAEDRSKAHVILSDDDQSSLAIYAEQSLPSFETMAFLCT